MSLRGKRVVVTRAPHQAQKLADMLTARGAVPVIFPCIDIEPPADPAPMDDALRGLASYDWVLLTSANTVIALEKRMMALGVPVSALNTLKIGTVGPKTAKVARQRLGVTVETVPDDYVAEGLAAALGDVRGLRVLLPQSAISRDVLGEMLADQGAEVVRIDAYRTVTGSGGGDLGTVGDADALTFTSSSTVSGFVERFGGVPDIPAACIGPIAAQTARDCGFAPVMSPAGEYSLSAMLDGLADYFKTR